ncbi:cupin domain-containing protein [Undibacterium sp. Jales W-56]|uniref:cupin domain-containing protein n=1 Tax=Undibacterium sp. Jales W-56 TaxID=2897325 RepID=UPI0021D0FBB3|nr:cupin domain-containing protein [Undibacterium sp. Jales W-56]MCU6433290.1 cupin domain-containing protein [Undibacterium sp. Jales W-56]
MKNLSTKLPLLGNLTADQFLNEYWHKKPLLIRQAIPGFNAPIDKDMLFDMAAQENVESRLICFFNQHWEMSNGPFQQLPVKEKKDWTLLVQGVNLHNPVADELLRQFNFIADTRLDDLMISYASDGGGVGPHFDSYDVFLLQAHGQRRWKISAQKDLSLIEGMPLKILRNFKAEQEFVLEPGDMLYLPPQYAHDGAAIGECMTYSIGFRAPSYQELGESFLQFMSDSIDLPGRYADPELKATLRPAEISSAMVDTIAQQLAKIRFTEEDITIFIGEYLSTPKSSVFFNSPAKPLTPKRFTQAAQKNGVSLSLKTQMLYKGKHVFVNGESFAIGKEDKVSLLKLANQRRLEGAEVAQVSDDVMEALCLWYEDGWLTLNS